MFQTTDPADIADPGKPRPRAWAKRAIGVALVIVGVAGLECASRQLNPTSYGRATSPAAAAGLARTRSSMKEQHGATKGVAAEDRVTRWLGLVGQFVQIEGELECGEANTILDELFEVMPAAPDWPALDAAIRARATAFDRANPHWLVLSALGHYLNARPAAMRREARDLGRVVSWFGWQAGWEAEVVVDDARHLEGDFAADLARIEVEATHGEHRRSGRVNVPELFDLMGPDRAESILERALLLRDPVDIRRGPRTLAAARRLALELVPRLRCPQFDLAQGLDQGPLYDALGRRFPVTAEQCRSERDGFAHRERMTAAAYRVADLLRKGREGEARALAPYLPLAMRGYTSDLDGAGAALARAGDLVALKKFEEFRKTLPLKDAPNDGWGRSNLVDVQVRELLSRGRVDDALPAMRAQLTQFSAMEASGERAADTWAERAWRFVELGTLLDRPALLAEGLAEVAKAPVKARLDAHQCGVPERDVSTALIGLGKTEAGLQRARELVAWTALNPPNPSQSPPKSQEALRGLAGALHHAGRSGEVLELLESADGWLATDLADIVVEPAGGVPLGVAVARGLEQRGRLAEARDVIARVLRHRLECDAAYEIHARVGGAGVVPLLDELMRDNPLAVRPLVWRGLRYVAEGDRARGEALLRRAIELDPLDREQVAPARMRAHRALSALPGYGAEMGPLLRAAELDARARDLKSAGLTDHAIALQRSALELVPSYAALRLELAQALEEQGLHEDALGQYRRAFDDMLAHGCASCCKRSGCGSSLSLYEALARFALEAALAAAPEAARTSATAHHLRAILAAREGSMHDRIRSLEAALKVDPDHWPSLLALHEIDREMRDEHLPGMSFDADNLTRNLLRLDPGRVLHTPAARLLRDPAALWPSLERAARIESQRTGKLLAIPRGRARTDQWARREPQWTSASAGFLELATPFRGVKLVLRDLRENAPGLAGRMVRWLGSR